MSENIQRRVIVTGAAAGIGLAITQHCLAAGYYVVACDINRHGLEQLRHSPSSHNLTVQPIDVADCIQVDHLFHRIADAPVPAGLVNNAGIYLGKNILEYSVEEMHRVMGVNCMGPLYLSRKFAELLLAREQTGSIVNIHRFRRKMVVRMPCMACPRLLCSG